MAVVHNLLPRIVKSGLGVLPPAAGVAALAAVLCARAAPPAQVVVSPFEWPKLMAGADRVFPVSVLYILRRSEQKCPFWRSIAVLISLRCLSQLFGLLSL